ncbi:MAG TPA: matrixin family metalloprotease [Bacteriovoracaceae bacterium]|nr:matrixin family metalloprotease [Bacteriovoracaceae bacterium]
MKALVLFFLLTAQAEAYTLNNNFGGAFKDSNVDVLVDEQTTCPNVGLTVYELQDIVSEAVENFWNKVPTSNLRLSAAGFSAPVANISDGKLCSATDDACISAAMSAGNLIPPVNEIIIACNTLNTNFGGANVLAVTIPNKFSGKKIEGAIILLNEDPSSSFSNLSRDDKVSVIAHEIGHAIGLGHAEPDHDEALMYYRTVKLRRNLAQDDMDGVSYLYPVIVDGCGLFGTLDSTKRDPPYWQLGITLGLMILLSELRRLFNRPKTGTPA